jgi:hypothetical protein|tara:strand:- start:6882 stop:7187 length:306 start_codon:yes stop_codon:yes gene_type:complete
MASVYVPQKPFKLDISDAERFGDIHFLNAGGDVYRNSEAAMESIRDGLENITGDDHILLIGDPVMLSAAVAIAAKKLQGRIRVLKYDRQKSVYVSILIDLW